MLPLLRLSAFHINTTRMGIEDGRSGNECEVLSYFFSLVDQFPDMCFEIDATITTT